MVSHIVLSLYLICDTNMHGRLIHVCFANSFVYPRKAGISQLFDPKITGKHFAGNGEIGVVWAAL